MRDDQISNWGAAMIASFTDAMSLFFSAIPRVLAALVILVIGWIVAAWIAKGIAALLRSVRFNELSERSGFSGFVQNMGVKTDAAGFLALLVKWFVRLIVLVVAFDALGLPAVSDVLRQLLLWLPNLVVALVVLVIGGLAANALSSLIRGATAKAGFTNPQLLEKVAYVAVWAFAVVVAVNQLGIAQTLVNTLFMALVGSAALAMGLAFGLGGRDTAGEIVRGWYRRGQEASPKIERAAQEAGADIGQRPSPAEDETRRFRTR